MTLFGAARMTCSFLGTAAGSSVFFKRACVRRYVCCRMLLKRIFYLRRCNQCVFPPNVLFSTNKAAKARRESIYLLCLREPCHDVVLLRKNRLLLGFSLHLERSLTLHVLPHQTFYSAQLSLLLAIHLKLYW